MEKLEKSHFFIYIYVFTQIYVNLEQPLWPFMSSTLFCVQSTIQLFKQDVNHQPNTEHFAQFPFLLQQSGGRRGCGGRRGSRIISTWTIRARQELRPRLPCVEILHGPMAFHPPGQLSSSANAGQSKQSAALQTLTLAQDVAGEESKNEGRKHSRCDVWWVEQHWEQCAELWIT